MTVDLMDGIVDPPSAPWGIVLEWDEDGLECCIWAVHVTIGTRLDFSSAELAQVFIDDLELADPPGTAISDVIATPRRLGDTGPLITPRPLHTPRPYDLQCTSCFLDLNVCICDR